MARNIPSNENQKPPNKATLPSKVLNQDGRPNEELPRKKKFRRIDFYQISSARDAKGLHLLSLRKRKKSERERNTGTKNGNE